MNSDNETNTKEIGTHPTPSKDVELGQGKDEADPSVREDLDEDGNAYPPFANVLVIMIALYLALFIVALVSLPNRIEFRFNQELPETNLNTGSHHHSNSYSAYDRRLPLLRRHRLVRKRLHDNQLRLPTHLWTYLHILPHQVGLLGCHWSLRTRKSDLWRCT